MKKISRENAFDQALVVRKVDSAIYWINYYPKDSVVFVILILWIAIYPVDSAIQLLNNRELIKMAKTTINNVNSKLNNKCN